MNKHFKQLGFAKNLNKSSAQRVRASQQCKICQSPIRCPELLQHRKSIVSDAGVAKGRQLTGEENHSFFGCSDILEAKSLQLYGCGNGYTCSSSCFSGFSILKHCIEDFPNSLPFMVDFSRKRPSR